MKPAKATSRIVNIGKMIIGKKSFCFLAIIGIATISLLYGIKFFPESKNYSKNKIMNASYSEASAGAHKSSESQKIAKVHSKRENSGDHSAESTITAQHGKKYSNEVEEKTIREFVEFCDNKELLYKILELLKVDLNFKIWNLTSEYDYLPNEIIDLECNGIEMHFDRKRGLLAYYIDLNFITEATSKKHIVTGITTQNEFDRFASSLVGILGYDEKTLSSQYDELKDVNATQNMEQDYVRDNEKYYKKNYMQLIDGIDASGELSVIVDKSSGNLVKYFDDRKAIPEGMCVNFKINDAMDIAKKELSALGFSSENNGSCYEQRIVYANNFFIEGNRTVKSLSDTHRVWAVYLEKDVSLEYEKEFIYAFVDVCSGKIVGGLPLK